MVYLQEPLKELEYAESDNSNTANPLPAGWNDNIVRKKDYFVTSNTCITITVMFFQQHLKIQKHTQDFDDAQM